ncbi:hypothetical protein CWB96_03400 [Pseudoalteromonas citrea]|uniref:TonB C-terminal domain-containing protein n=1 Tax=Pseudoalteromonas citrea TaxID=43655 RepID=A0A5S3XVE5_9GAMM|nr:hypothetical protein [Pseudoalteromonas citrea]TMP43162.1 hypothetical protein CWB97_09785 [Pseudoalteromonas citrea]TMP61703.1 hypothetical protein CWB96_03400 [Pseudoalteromonas citrea]
MRTSLITKLRAIFIGSTAVLLVSTLFMGMHLMKAAVDEQKELVIRPKVDVALLTPPPPPPPPLKSANKSANESTTIDIMGLGSNLQVKYSKNPTMAIPKVESLDVPQLDLSEFQVIDTFSTSVPMLKVEHLDNVPKVISQKYIKPPKSVRKYGNNRIATKVKLIIDQTGKPYISKIIDPVYPEMIKIIKLWVQQAKFEIPKKEGKPVQAVYFYGINFNYG